MTTIVVQLTARALTPVMVVFSIYLLVRGHGAPGGGFIAATVAGLAVVLRTYAFGVEGIERLLRLGVDRLMGIGLVIALATGAGGWLWGGAFLEAASVALHLPIVGGLELSTTLLFEVGVYLTVLSVVVAVVGEMEATER